MRLRRRPRDGEDSWDSWSSPGDSWDLDAGSDVDVDDWLEQAGDEAVDDDSRTVAWATSLAAWGDGSQPAASPAPPPMPAAGTSAKAFFVPTGEDAPQSRRRLRAWRFVARLRGAARRLRLAMWPFVHRRIGPYRVGERIGASATGTSYLALHTENGRRYVIKRLVPHLRHGTVSGDAYLRAAGEASSWGLERVVSAKQLAVKGRETYLVYSRRVGCTLAMLLAEDGRLAPRRSRDLALGLCDALLAVHERGSVHGFVGPAHVVVSPRSGGDDGPVRVSELGVPAALAALRASRHSSWGRWALRSGFVAPEVRSGADPDVATDVYGVGAVLYAMLVGRPPGRSNKLRVPRFVPADTRRFMTQCLNVDPCERPASIVAARHALSSLASDFRRMQRRSERRRWYAVARWVGASAVLVSVVWGLLSLPQLAEVRQQLQQSLAAVVLQGRTALRGHSTRLCTSVHDRQRAARAQSRAQRPSAMHAGALGLLARVCQAVDTPATEVAPPPPKKRDGRRAGPLREKPGGRRAGPLREKPGGRRVDPSREEPGRPHADTPRRGGGRRRADTPPRRGPHQRHWPRR